MLRAICLFLALLAPEVASASSIFLNGINIDGVTNQAFNNCTVIIDAQGNIFITAKGYAVAAPGAGAQAPGIPGAALPTAPAPAVAPVPVAVPTVAATPVVTQRYWLVTEKAAPGMTQYDIDLFVNSKFVRRFLDDEEHVVLEITKFLQPGQNKLVLMAKKNLGAGRRSASPQHFFRVIIGEGDSGGRNVMINRKLVDYKRTALETTDQTDEFFLNAR
jgi:hypothetical protein